MARLRALPAAIAVVLLLACASRPASANADDDFLTEFLPDILDTSDASGKLCQDDQYKCLDKLVEEMDKRFQVLKNNCSHNAVFSLLYMRVTDYTRKITKECTASSCLFSDPKFVARYASIFAGFFFKAQTRFEQGRLDEVPEPWQIAFNAANNKELKGLGNLLVGVNAHINHDLAFAIEIVLKGLLDTFTRYGDHKKVDDLLLAVNVPATQELEARFDPQLSTTPFVLGGTTVQDLSTSPLYVWRQQAWENARLLMFPPLGLTRAIVVANIKATSKLTALSLKSQFLYDGLGGGGNEARMARDDFCALNKDVDCWPNCPLV